MKGAKNEVARNEEDCEDKFTAPSLLLITMKNGKQTD